jgi:hypothetical protein
MGCSGKWAAQENVLLRNMCCSGKCAAQENVLLRKMCCSGTCAAQEKKTLGTRNRRESCESHSVVDHRFAQHEADDSCPLGRIVLRRIVLRRIVLFQVKSVEPHYLRPCSGKIVYEPLLAVATGVNLCNGSQL